MSVHVLSDDGQVAEVTAAAADPSSFASSFHQSSLFEGLGLVGGWISVHDGDGNAVVAEGLAFRLNQGVFWTDPDYVQSPLLVPDGTGG